MRSHERHLASQRAHTSCSAWGLCCDCTCQESCCGADRAFPLMAFSSFPWPQPLALHTHQTHARLVVPSCHGSRLKALPRPQRPCVSPTPSSLIQMRCLSYRSPALFSSGCVCVGMLEMRPTILMHASRSAKLRPAPSILFTIGSYHAFSGYPCRISDCKGDFADAP